MLEQGVLQQVCYGIIRAAGSPQTREQAIQIGILLGTARRGDGPEAGACNLTAAVLHGMAEDREPLIHILTRRNLRHHEGYRFHYTSRLPVKELIRVKGLWCTDPCRTFLDLCGSSPRLAPWVFRRGLRNGVLDREGVTRRIEMEARQGRAGLVVAREIIDQTFESARRAKSGKEDRYHDYLVTAGYPPPQRNVKLPGSFGHPWEVDLYYPQVRAGLEISPYDIHGDPEVFLRDGRKRLDLEGQGIRIWAITEDLSFHDFVAVIRPLLGPPLDFPTAESVG